MPDRQAITPIASVHLDAPYADSVPPAPSHLMEAIVRVVQQLQPAPAPVDPIAHIRALEDAFQNNWVLGTSELAQLLKIAPKTLARHEKLERYGFVCVRAGHNGSELGWKIRKPKSKSKKK